MWETAGIKRKLKILDFDIETRPLSFWIDGNPTAEITAIATCWVTDWTTMTVHMLGKSTPQEMLTAFVERYNEADIVVGHYIRKFDLPMINGALMEYGLPQLGPKLVQDTRLDMNKKMGIPASQEFLSDLFDLPVTKHHMSQHKWRVSNRLSSDGIAEAERRVTSDVMGNMYLRNNMIAAGLLKSPSMWYP